MKRQVTIERMNEGGAERKWTLRFYLWNKKKMMTMMKGDVLLFPFSERDKIETPSSHVLLVVVPFICHVLLYFYSYFIPFLPFNFQILSTVPSKVLKEEEMEINIRFYFLLKQRVGWKSRESSWWWWWTETKTCESQWDFHSWNIRKSG